MDMLQLRPDKKAYESVLTAMRIYTIQQPDEMVNHETREGCCELVWRQKHAG